MQEISKNFELLHKSILQIQSNVTDHARQITSVNQFIELLKKLDHLFDIDEVWRDTETLKSDVEQISVQIIQMNKTASVHDQHIGSLMNFVESTKKLQHLHDVDEMWENIEQSESKSNLLQGEVTSLEEKLAAMNKQMI